MAVGNFPALGSEADAVMPSADDCVLARESAQRMADLLSRSDIARRVQIGGDDEPHAEVTLPASALRLLARLLEEMAQGHAVTLLPLQTELTTQQAADLLNVSRPFVVRLIDEGDIPARKVGTHRRVRLRDVLDFKRRDEERRHATADKLVALSQEMELY